MRFVTAIETSVGRPCDFDVLATLTRIIQLQSPESQLIPGAGVKCRRCLARGVSLPTGTHFHHIYPSAYHFPICKPLSLPQIQLNVCDSRGLQGGRASIAPVAGRWASWCSAVKLLPSCWGIPSSMFRSVSECACNSQRVVVCAAAQTKQETSAATAEAEYITVGSPSVCSLCIRSCSDEVGLLSSQVDEVIKICGMVGG
jgi:hypothetical protein